MAKRRRSVRRSVAARPVATPEPGPPIGFESPWLGAVAATAIAFVLYVRGLAPSVTFEDSGELVAAAHGWGIPHAPGYPLYTLLAKLFTLVPLGSVAYRVNLMSAFFSALAVGGVYLIALRLIADGRPEAPEGRAVAPVCALSGALLVGMAPVYFGQAVIAEVYGLNNFFFALLLLILVRWAADRRPSWFEVACGVLGLALTNHHTAGVFGPLILLVWVSTDTVAFRQWRTTWPSLVRRAGRGAAFWALGLLPYAYLPLASRREPLIDWGDPETPGRFWDLVSRSQYGLDWAAGRDLATYVSQLGLQLGLLLEQFHPVLVLIGLWGALRVWRLGRPYGLLMVAYLLLTGPVMAFVTNAGALETDPLIYAEERGAVAVWYLPLFLLWGVLIAVGVAHAARSLARRAGQPAAAWVVAFGLVAFVAQASVQVQATEGQRRATFADQYAKNIFTLAEPGSLVLGNWDPFVFPLMHAQAVEGEGADVVVLDTQLLRLSWYVDMMRRWYPDFMARAQTEIETFLTAVRPLEAGGPFDGARVQETFHQMLRALIALGHADGAVYVAFHPRMRNFEPVLAEEFRLDSCLVAFELRRPDRGGSDCAEKSYDLTGMLDTPSAPAYPMDRMTRMVRSYYALLHRSRGTVEQEDSPVRAAAFYRTALALEADPFVRDRLRDQIDRLEGVGR